MRAENRSVRARYHVPCGILSDVYYEIHGTGDPIVLLHGSFMTITNNWAAMIPQLSKSRKVIAVEMQGHGRTPDIGRDFSYENLAGTSLLDARFARVSGQIDF